jgi:hypothetical protein
MKTKTIAVSEPGTSATDISETTDVIACGKRCTKAMPDGSRCPSYCSQAKNHAGAHTCGNGHSF